MVPNSTARQSLHGLEQMHVSAAYRQFLTPAANPHEQAAELVAPGAGEMVEIDDGRAVDLLEARRIEQRRQLGDGGANQVLAGRGADAGVLVIGIVAGIVCVGG